MKLNSFLTLTGIFASQSCGQTTTLPPLGAAPDTSVQPNAPTTTSTSPDSGDGTTRKRTPPSNDPMAQQVAAYLAGKPITVARAGKNEVCFSNLGKPCQGNYVDSGGKIRALTATDACDVNIAGGKVNLTIWDSNETLLYEIKIAAPTSFIPPPNVIEDSGGRVVINQTCQL